MRKFEMPQEDTEKTSYANQEPEFENKSLVETTDGRKVIIIDYLKAKGLYVVSDIDKSGTTSPLYRLSPGKLKPIEKSE